MYFLSKIGICHCYVSLPEGIWNICLQETPLVDSWIRNFPASTTHDSRTFTLLKLLGTNWSNTYTPGSTNIAVQRKHPFWWYLPGKNGDFPAGYVSLPEGNFHFHFLVFVPKTWATCGANVFRWQQQVFLPNCDQLKGAWSWPLNYECGMVYVWHDLMGCHPLRHWGFVWFAMPGQIGVNMVKLTRERYVSSLGFMILSARIFFVACIWWPFAARMSILFQLCFFLQKCWHARRCEHRQFHGPLASLLHRSESADLRFQRIPGRSMWPLHRKEASQREGEWCCILYTKTWLSIGVQGQQWLATKNKGRFVVRDPDKKKHVRAKPPSTSLNLKSLILNLHYIYIYIL